MASSSRTHPFGLLPAQIRSRIYSLLIPERLEFVKFSKSRKSTQPAELILPVIQLMQQFPHLAREMRLRLFLQPEFAFVSSVRNGQYSHGCQLALEFLNSIQSVDIGYIRKIRCDLEWKTRAEYADTFFQMLARLATNPTRDIKDLEFEVEQVPGVKRPNRGISTPSFAVTLRGLIGLEIVIFVSGSSHLPDPVTFVPQINEWIQQRHDACLTVNFLEKLPPELRLMVFRCLPLPSHHVIGPLNARMPISCVHLLQVNRRMKEEIIPILYGDCVFELRATSSWRRARRENSCVSDQAPWISAFLRNAHATLIKRTRIVLKVHGNRASDYTPPINTIIAELRRRCKFQIQDTYEAHAVADIPITSNEWNSAISKRCFQVKLATQCGTELVVEIQAGWDNWELVGHVPELQEHAVRTVYSRSVNGMRSKVDFNGNVIDA
ncbi:MAG: hypothetical protein Q9161_000261 [Pseudevernia consocians]